MQVEGIGVASQENAMPPKAPFTMLGYVLSGVLAVPMAAIILQADLSTGIACVRANAHCTHDGASKWMMLIAAVAIAADIALVLNLLMGKARAWLSEQPVE
ncbi:hypothetical protein [Sphingomonas sp. S-NIH.Pt15_0812]|uniref:hypothetical protein n=1 Tax=Sphingomonas sp. S-NIH.Pt15_0812 TaxID=1920129 RepID=UPI000F7EF7D1|nr:hypothetical protein [Sphingomonas sp. S-NIH.Pt15_0812]RSU46324.1 hypothetical protein BRX43_15795 [Sphingomonas sp. S-NIH.Pt15_0812]